MLPFRRSIKKLSHNVVPIIYCRKKNEDFQPSCTLHTLEKGKYSFLNVRYITFIKIKVEKVDFNFKNILSLSFDNLHFEMIAVAPRF